MPQVNSFNIKSMPLLKVTGANGITTKFYKLVLQVNIITTKINQVCIIL